MYYRAKKTRLKHLCSLLFTFEESFPHNRIQHRYYFKRSKVIQPNGSWPERNPELSFCGKCQHFNIFSNTAIFKKSPNSCCWPTFLASSTSHSAKTQQKGCLFTACMHHVYKTCPLFLADSSGGSTISSAFHSQSSSQARGIPSWMCTKATISQDNDKRTSSPLHCLLTTTFWGA